uniref:Solute carrier family 35 member G1 n=1 Tax=Aceria tosichella TaxID=561515 RepID=A0A6G1SMA6_9ACAR
MEPKRKEGICLTTNPVLQNRLNSYGTMSNSAPSNNRQSCDFTTFKGHQQLEATKNSPLEMEPAQYKSSSAKEKEASGGGGNIFQIVPLDNSSSKYDPDTYPIGPMDSKKTPQSPNANDYPKEPFRFAGYLGAITASVVCSLSILCLKLLPVEDNIQEKAKACMIRGMFLVIFCSIAILREGHSFMVAKGEYMLNFFRAVLGSVNILVIYVAIKFITMGECTALVFSSPIWTCILGFIILKEPLKISLLMAVPMSLIGIILLAHPDLLVDTKDEIIATGLQLHTNATSNHTTSYITPNTTTTINPFAYQDNHQHHVNETTIPLLDDTEVEDEAVLFFQNRLPGIILAIIGSMILSVVIIILKFRKKTPIVTCSLWLGVAMVIVSIIVQLVLGFGALPVTILECVLHTCIGVFSYATQILFQWALQYVPAGSYSVIRSLDIVLSFIMGALFLGEVVLWTSILGSILIMLVVAILMLDEYFERTLKWLCCSWWRSDRS